MTAAGDSADGPQIVVTPRDDDANPREAVQELERTADNLRNNLTALVGELGRRGKKAALPVAIGAAVLAALSIVGGLVWRRRQKRHQPSRLRNIGQALSRAAAHPDRVARSQPRGLSKVGYAAAAAVASVAARKLAKRWL
jgi:hypothetical protein